MWRLNGPRDVLLQHGFIRDDRHNRYIENNAFHEYGGELYINDNEDFFRREVLCIEWEDDSLYTPDHICTENDDIYFDDLVQYGIAIWEQ